MERARRALLDSASRRRESIFAQDPSQDMRVSSQLEFSTKPVAGEKAVKRPREVPFHSGKPGPLNHLHFLDHLIQKIKSKYPDRYGTFLESDQGKGLKYELENNLNEKVAEIGQIGDFTLER